MRKLWLILAVLVLLSVAAGGWLLFTSRREWTTDSPAAAAEFARGREAQMRYYESDAHEAYARALALDPQMTAARLGLLETSRSKEERERLIAELRQTDLERLTERERFLVRHALLGIDHQEDARRELAEAFLAAHPRDAWALWVASADAWARKDYPRAQELYRRLLEVDPNWMMARNNLGYIAMAEGRFADAEQYFRTYLYVAPDQANPHDSLGELLVLLGRYDEAREQLEAGLAVRPDFCASYENLIRAAIFERRPELLEPLTARMEEHCGHEQVAVARCTAFLGRALIRGEWDAPWRETQGPCADPKAQDLILVHLLALASGRVELALAKEADLRAVEKKAAQHGSKVPRQLRSLLLYLEGERLAFAGELEAAITRLRQADAETDFWEPSGPGGTLKLLELLALARALEANGDAAGAQEALSRLRAVNPSFAQWFGLLPPWRARGVPGSGAAQTQAQR